MGFALTAIITAIVATFSGSPTDIGKPEQTAEVAVTEPIQISEVTTAIKEVISVFVTENHSDDEELNPVAAEIKIVDSEIIRSIYKITMDRY